MPEVEVNPLQPFTYHRRHKRQALLLAGLIILVTLGLYIMVAVLDSVTLTPADVSYLKRVSQIHPNIELTFEPGVVSQIQTHPDVERVIPDNGLHIAVPSFGASGGLHLMGVSQDDVQYLMDRCGVRLKEGRLLEPRTNEIMLSEEIARALNLELGDQIDRSINAEYYWEIETPLVLVGILEGDPVAGKEPSVRVGFVSYEYLESHELYAPRIVSQIVVARQGRKGAVEEFLENTISSKRTEVRTYGRLYRLVAADRREVLIGLGIVNCLVAIAAAVIVGVINHIAMTQRVSELGLLNAFGHHRIRLIRRLALETISITGISWSIGTVLALLGLICLKLTIYYNRGMELDLTNLTPLWFTTPIPLTVVAFAIVGITRVFSRFDAVAILERGKLSLEAGLRGRWRAAEDSSVKPLSSLTFYLRHRRRGMVLIIGTALTILVITIPMFVESAITDAMKPNIEYLRYVSEVWSNEGRTVDAGVVGQIRSHPAIEFVVPVISLELQVPVPLGNAVRTYVHGVPENDLPVLVNSFGMQVAQGRLPRAHSNEIVLSESVAQNHGLRIGDTIDLPFHVLGELDQMITYGTPVEMVVSGILQPRTSGSHPGQAPSPDDPWLGFASYEYLESHESTASYPVRLFVVPANGRKDELDAWLEGRISSAQTQVATFRAKHSEIQRSMIEMALIFALTEVGIMIVAAIAVATMNYIFFTQRREEFGILHAVGRSRRWLVLRTIRETASAVVVAWLLSAVVHVISLVSVQAIVYAPRGLGLDIFNPIPWLFTLPIPLAVVAASAGTIGWVLSRLDPVAVIERK